MDYLTKEQVDLLKQEIDILMNSKYRSKTNELVRDTTIQELESRRAGEHEDVLENWKLEIENLKVLNLTLAYEPTKTNIIAFSSWVKKNVGKDVILDIDINPNIVAGAQIVWNGIYKDYSYSETTNADIQRLLS